MKVGDIVTLFAKGYTKEQIVEIKGMEATDPSILDAAKGVKNYEELKGMMELAADSAQENPQGDLGKDADTPPESAADKPQSEELETLRKKTEELEKQLKAAQDANASTDLSQSQSKRKTLEDTLSDIFQDII